MKLLMSILILAGGVACAWFYLRKPAAKPPLRSVSEDSPVKMIRGNRPWRRVGAAICLVLAIMFVLGVYLVDIPQRPRAYAAFWLVMVVLVIWLCILAAKDILYTRQVIAKWRAERKTLRDARRARAGDGSHSVSHTGSQESQP